MHEQPQTPSKRRWYTLDMILIPGVHPAALEHLAPPLAPAEVDRLADEIAEVASLIDAAEHRLLTLIRRFDEGSGWATHGALSCAHWLNWRIGLDLGAARERVRVARALATLPLVDDALRRGAISYSKVRAITRVASAATEATLLEMATHATASQLERICRGYRRVVADAEAGPPPSLADEERARFVRVRETDDGMVRIEARLRPEEAAVVLQALDVARRRAWRAGAVRAADAGGVSAEVRGADTGGASGEDGAADTGGVCAEARAASVGGVSAEGAPGTSPGETAERPAGPATEVPAETPPSALRAGVRQPHEPAPALSRADALVAVAESWLASVAFREDSHDTAGLPVELVVHVDRVALAADTAAGTDGTDDRRDDRRDPDGAAFAPHATLADGTPLALATARRLACDASVVLVDDTLAGAAVVTAARDTDGARDAHADARDVHEASDAHDAQPDARAASGAASLPSRRTRRISPRLRRALRLRDDGCRFPGCTNRITDAHHVVAWIDGGTTGLSNLLSLCRRHHRFVHEHGYRVVARDGGPRFFRRDGQPVPLADESLRSPLASEAHAGGTGGATATAAAPDALAALRAAHTARGLAIDATTAFPRWDGTPLDAHLAVQALLGAADFATTRGS